MNKKFVYQVGNNKKVMDILVADMQESKCAKGSSDLRFCNTQSHGIFKVMLNFQQSQFTIFHVVVIPCEGAAA